MNMKRSKEGQFKIRMSNLPQIQARWIMTYKLRFELPCDAELIIQVQKRKQRAFFSCVSSNCLFPVNSATFAKDNTRVRPGFFHHCDICKNHLHRNSVRSLANNRPFYPVYSAVPQAINPQSPYYILLKSCLPFRAPFQPPSTLGNLWPRSKPLDTPGALSSLVLN